MCFNSCNSSLANMWLSLVVREWPQPIEVTYSTNFFYCFGNFEHLQPEVRIYKRKQESKKKKESFSLFLRREQRVFFLFFQTVIVFLDQFLGRKRVFFLSCFLLYIPTSGNAAPVVCDGRTLAGNIFGARGELILVLDANTVYNA